MWKLIIVARNHPQLWRLLKTQFAADEGVEVILDRRHDHGQQPSQGREGGRRMLERRRPSRIEADIDSRGYIFACPEQLTWRLPLGGLLTWGGF